MMFQNFLRVISRSIGLLLFTALISCSQTKLDSGNSPAEMATDAGDNASDGTSTEVASLPVKSKIPAQAKPKIALPTLHEMIGLDRDQVTALLGTPKFRRQDSPADLWQYGNKKCALDLFLYKIRDGNIYKVTHVEVRTLNGAKVTKAKCFEGLVRAHNALGTG